MHVFLFTAHSVRLLAAPRISNKVRALNLRVEFAVASKHLTFSIPGGNGADGNRATWTGSPKGE
jgi:hypothetical protein